MVIELIISNMRGMAVPMALVYSAICFEASTLYRRLERQRARGRQLAERMGAEKLPAREKIPAERRRAEYNSLLKL